MTADELAVRRPSNDTIRPLETFGRAASATLDTNRHLVRPSVPERAKGLDHTGKTMAQYINGLEARLIDHMRKHAPRWQQKEAARVLTTWHAPTAKHPAPSWAASRDAMADADGKTWTVVDLTVERSGKYDFAFSYDAPPRLSGDLLHSPLTGLLKRYRKAQFK